MNQNDVHDKLLEQSDQINLIGDELRWILDECKEKNIQPGTPLGLEMQQKFFSLYRDFKRIKEETFCLAEQMNAMTFEDRTLGLIYCATANLLIRRINQGIFEQFTSVAEHGCLPDGISLDDLSA